MSVKLPKSRNFFLWISMAFIAIFWFGFDYLPFLLLKLIFFIGFITMFLHVFPSSQQWLQKMLNKKDG